MRAGAARLRYRRPETDIGDTRLANIRQNADLSERELIRWIRRSLALAPASPSTAPGATVLIGPGDDAALLDLPSRRLIAKVDTIAEGVDFTLDTATPALVGRKAVAINLSDIAAMGGRPVFCLASAILRPGLGAAFQKALSRGLITTAARFGCPLVGGDITGWKGGVALTVMACGVPAGKRAITRAGARPGDVVLVTGALGGSILGHHLKFTPRLAEAAFMAREFPPSAMIDISDGLGVDSGHIAAESGVAIEIDARRIPISPAARRLARSDGRSALYHAVADGEDFELLFTMPPARARRLMERWPFARTRLTAIGAVAPGGGVYLRDADGHRTRIDTLGYEHLR